MKQTKKHNELEFLAATVMIPPVFWNDFEDGTSEGEMLTGKDMHRYVNTLNHIVFAPKRDYTAFRSFLAEHTGLFGDRYKKLAAMDDRAIEYVLERIREERVGSLLEGFAQ